jgi:hypothetical protein
MTAITQLKGIVEERRRLGRLGPPLHQRDGTA